MLAGGNFPKPDVMSRISGRGLMVSRLYKLNHTHNMKAALDSSRLNPEAAWSRCLLQARGIGLLHQIDGFQVVGSVMIVSPDAIV